MNNHRRTDVVPLRRTMVTPDVAEALREAEERALAAGCVLSIGGPHTLSWEGVKNDAGPTGCPPHISMRCTGREIQFKLQRKGSKALGMTQDDVEALWGLLVPLGWTPWTRYPVAGTVGHDVFHYYGPWRPLYDSLLGEGLGEKAWPSLCAAAQLDVGRWGGEREVERFVQAQLHRMGHPVGPVDGIIGPRTLASMAAAGVGSGMTLSILADKLAKSTDAAPAKSSRRRGFLSVDGPHEVFGTGGVSVVRNKQGAAITIDGPGRLLVEVR